MTKTRTSLVVVLFLVAFIVVTVGFARASLSPRYASAAEVVQTSSDQVIDQNAVTMLSQGRQTFATTRSERNRP